MKKGSLNLKITKKIYFLNFNQDNTCFCIGTDEGYELYNCEPLKRIKKKKYGKYGICYIAMLYRTNILGLIEKSIDLEKTEEKKLLLYDDKNDKIHASILFHDQIQNIYLSTEYIVVCLRKDIFIYELETVKLIKKINCNITDLVSICAKYFKIIIPDTKDGILNILTPDSNLNWETLKIEAHKTSVHKTAFSESGNYIATCSKKGTLIRIFHTVTGQLVKELRRGTDEAIINWLNFSSNEEYLLCQSKKGTVHVFHTEITSLKNKNTKFSKITNYFKNYLPSYFESEWSFAHFHFPNVITISSFSKIPNNINVISFKGIVYKINYENTDYVTISKQSI